jgi:hypothetical protein
MIEMKTFHASRDRLRILIVIDNVRTHGSRSIRFLPWNILRRIASEHVGVNDPRPAVHPISCFGIRFIGERRRNRRSDATDEFLLSSNTMSANANVGQAVAQDLATTARTVTIVVNGVDWSRYLDQAPGARVYVERGWRRRVAYNSKLRLDLRDLF